MLIPTSMTRSSRRQQAGILAIDDEKEFLGFLKTTAAISNVKSKEFNRLFTFNNELVPYIGVELQWYADDAKNVIGTIAKGTSDACWRYTILRRNLLGNFLVSTLSRDFMDLQTARATCLQEMATASDGQCVSG
jgi:hypothetical protein